MSLAVGIGWESIKAEAKKWINKIIILKKNLYGARENIKEMKSVLARFPQNAKLQEQRTALIALEKSQKKHEETFFGLEGKFLGLLDQLGIKIPGLSGMAILPLAVPIVVAAGILGALALLYVAVSSHLLSVAKQKALIDKLTPEGAKEELKKEEGKGFFGEAKNLILLGIVATIILPMIRGKG